MNILFVCKRYYTNKDVIRDRFGRLYEIPSQLAQLGHSITILCLDYRNNDQYESFVEKFSTGTVQWINITLRDIFTLKIILTYYRIRTISFDLIFGSSDILCLWLTSIIAKWLKLPYVVDLYDNYESFGQARILGLVYILRKCVIEANLIITVSQALKNKIYEEYKPRNSILIMNNGSVCKNFFVGDKIAARLKLNLPINMKLIGTAGHLSPMKGLDTVYAAWKKIETQTNDICLVLAGHIEKNFPIPLGHRVIYLGELLEEEVGQLFRALDVGIIPAHNTEFGRYCFPQKLFEMISCGLPIVAANVGAISDMLQSYPKIMFKPGDSEHLITAINYQLEFQTLTNLKPLTWSDAIKIIELELINLKN